MGRDVYALICPDWRGPSVVLEGAQGFVAHANLRGLRLLKGDGPARIAGGRLVIDPEPVNRRFYARLERALANGVERSALVIRHERAQHWLSAMIHLPQGFASDALGHQLGDEADVRQLAVVEFAATSDLPDKAALAAFAESIGLAPAESQLILAMVQGASATEIAAERGSSLSTVRQRIKSVLAKATCARQSELMGLIRAICPAGDRVS